MKERLYLSGNMVFSVFFQIFLQENPLLENYVVWWVFQTIFWIWSSMNNTVVKQDVMQA